MKILRLMNKIDVLNKKQEKYMKKILLLKEKVLLIEKNKDVLIYNSL
jgi:hypothetical protein